MLLIGWDRTSLIHRALTRFFGHRFGAAQLDLLLEVGHFLQLQLQLDLEVRDAQLAAEYVVGLARVPQLRL